jgi:hypothetical protein
MKSLLSKLTLRTGLLALLAGSAVTAAVASQPVVTVDLGGTTFGNNLDIHVNSGR